MQIGNKRKAPHTNAGLFTSGEYASVIANTQAQPNVSFFEALVRFIVLGERRFSA